MAHMPPRLSSDACTSSCCVEAHLRGSSREAPACLHVVHGGCSLDLFWTEGVQGESMIQMVMIMMMMRRRMRMRMRMMMTLKMMTITMMMRMVMRMMMRMRTRIAMAAMMMELMAVMVTAVLTARCG